MLNSQGEKVYDSNPEEDQENYGEMEEIQEAQDQGTGQALRFSGIAFSSDLLLCGSAEENGDILRVGKDRGQYFPYYGFQLSSFGPDHGADPGPGFSLYELPDQKAY